jgi:hypothetical protein
MSRGTASAGTLAEGNRDLRMGRLVWILLVIAFLIWLALVGGAVVWGRSVFEHAARPVPSMLQGISGVVLYRESGQRAEVSAQPGMTLFEGDELTTSPGSTATLQGFDRSLLQIYPEARLRIEAAQVGRFNPAATQAAFALVGGTVRLSIPNEDDQPHRLQLTLGHASSATFGPGEYTVRAAEDATRISVWEGAVDATANGSMTHIGAGEKLILRWSNSSAPEVTDVLENVVLNSGFARSFESWDPWEEREQGRPDLPGHLEIVQPEEVGGPDRALHITRTSERDAHSDTGVRQAIGRDVAGARAVRIEALVRVDQASLSGGGYLGSEYPLMLRIRARDRRGGDQVWAQGFYYANPEDRPTQIGQLIPQGSWVKVSIDLSQLFTQTSSIDALEVFGAGHTFDASISDIELLVD